MTTNDKSNLLVMKLLHYFVTVWDYNPVIVHGVQNEIWLENMNCEFRIVRIVMSHIHNNEQLEFDNYKVERLSKQIKLKTFTMKLKTLSLYIDIDSSVEIIDDKNNIGVCANSEKNIKSNNAIKKYFPDMPDKLKFTEEGELLYERINRDILTKNIDQSEKINDLFRERKPVITYILIGIMFLVLVLMELIFGGSTNIKTLYAFGGLVKNHDYYRLITSIFIHIGIIHFVMNAWSLNIIGKQIESFYGHIKFLIIFIYSGIVGNLLSLSIMSDNTISAGASGAIFGLMGALLYFAINQRTYMSEALKKQIIPVILANLLIGFMIPGINIWAHIGGLIGGIIASMAVGVKYRTSKVEHINAIIVSILLLVLLSYFSYFS